MAERLAIVIKMTDEELMKAVHDGDHTAYKTLVNSHIKSVSRCAYRILRNRNDAADICQETFFTRFNRTTTGWQLWSKGQLRRSQIKIPGKSFDQTFELIPFEHAFLHSNLNSKREFGRARTGRRRARFNREKRVRRSLYSWAAT